MVERTKGSGGNIEVREGKVGANAKEDNVLEFMGEASGVEELQLANDKGWGVDDLFARGETLANFFDPNLSHTGRILALKWPRVT